MVGFPASAANNVCKPGRVATPPELNTTSWQSGETPCGRSAGAISVTSPLKISMGASNEPAVVIGKSSQYSVISFQSPLPTGRKRFCTGSIASYFDLGFGRGGSLLRSLVWLCYLRSESRHDEGLPAERNRRHSYF